jgi:hypothetical protein
MHLLAPSFADDFQIDGFARFGLADQPLGRQRKTVLGWTIAKLSRQPRHERDCKIRSSRRSERRKHVVLEVMALRHQIAVLERNRTRR